VRGLSGAEQASTRLTQRHFVKAFWRDVGIALPLSKWRDSRYLRREVKPCRRTRATGALRDERRTSLGFAWKPKPNPIGGWLGGWQSGLLVCASWWVKGKSASYNSRGENRQIKNTDTLHSKEQEKYAE